MMKVLLFLLLLFSQLVALDIRLEKTPVYKTIELSYSIASIQDAIDHPDKFLVQKQYASLFQKQSPKEVWLKLNLMNFSNETLNRVFITKWDRVDISLYGVLNKQIVFTQSIQNSDYLKRSEAIQIPANTKLDFYIHIKNNQPLSQFFYIYFLDERKANAFIINNERLYHHGLFLGILLTMTMYSFFMYFSIKEKGYLFLGFYQASVLVATSDLRHYFFILFENLPNFADFLQKGVFGYILMFLSILFTKEFLNTKEEMPRFNLFLNILMIFLLPISALQSNINYAAFLYLVYVFTGIYVLIHKKNLLALFYILGFLGFPLYLITASLSVVYNWNFYFEYHYAKQVFTCLESFTLTMALYLKIRSIVEENEKAKEEATINEKLMLEQSRFASMGEMLASIAHQWRQPLNHINMIMANLQLAFEKNRLDDTYMQKKSLEIDNQVKYMSQTVENFSNFFAPKEHKEEFYLSHICDYTLGLVESRLKKHRIDITVKNNNDALHMNYKNELIQVLSIVLNNAIDALVINEIKNPKIEVVIEYETLRVSDNAGGIEKAILAKIFDPYFSTKDKKFGTGLGLYTAKIIVNNLIKGKIEAINTKEGACFTIGFA